jgi:6-phosphogluconolactonase
MKHNIYIGTWSENLHHAAFNDETGELKPLGSVEAGMPSYLIYDSGVIYGVSEADGYVFSMSPDKLEILSKQSTNGKHPCHICAMDKWLFVSNYSEGTLTVFERGGKGLIKPSAVSLAHYGSGPNASRQERSHIHFAGMPPHNDFLAVCDLGTDKVLIYPFNRELGLLTNANVIDCPPGSGPRHLTFSEDNKYLYVLTELTSTVLVYSAVDGEIKLTQQISTLPDGFKEHNTAAAIRISPDKKTLAASNRGHDSVAMFAINGDGTLSPPTHLMTGKTPRDFTYSPCGKWMLVAEQDSGAVSVAQSKSCINIEKPTCIVFGGLIND